MQGPRQRNRPVLPLFDPRIEPTSATARVDKLEIVFPNHRVHYSSLQSLQSFLRFVAVSLPQDPLAATGGYSAPLFAQGNRRYKLAVRPGWLFSGSLFVRSPSEVRREAALEIALTLNPSRFLAHLRPEELRAYWRDPEAVLRVRRDRQAEASRYTLDGRDNVVPEEMIRTARPFGRYAARYVMAVIRLIEGRLAGYSDPAPLPGIGPSEWNTDEGTGVGCYQDTDFRIEFDWGEWVVKHAEVYWEFRARDAVSLTHHLETRLHAAVEEAATESYGVPRPVPPRRPGQARWRTLKNAIATTHVIGGDHINLIAYAKEFDRIRFEVRYSKNLRQALGRRSLQARGTSHPKYIRRLLTLAVEDASERLASIFASLEDTGGARQPVVLEGVTALFGAVLTATRGDQKRAARVLSLIVHHLAVSEAGLGDLRRPVLALVRQGVLIQNRTLRRSEGARWRVASEYREAAFLLASVLR